CLSCVVPLIIVHQFDSNCSSSSSSNDERRLHPAHSSDSDDAHHAVNFPAVS
ncbi:unnamed protein product, partial [Ceratitis capitata]